MPLKATLIAAALLTGIPLDACFAHVPLSMNKDLYADFKCPSHPQEASIETFLKGESFHVFNRQPLPTSDQKNLSDINIAAYDARRWTFIAYGPEPISPSLELYTVILTSPPPTQHDDALEDRIVAFFEHTLNCRITFETRGESPASLADFYDLTLKELKDEEQAAICDKTMAAYGEKNCSAAH